MGGFVKVVKNKAYFKRYQVKFRRRRAGVTDYRARRKLITQDKNKYATKKYRFVVRITNTKVICQFIYATLVGDITVATAESTELPRYGMKAGLANYAAAYSTGLLCARRLLQKYNLDSKFKGYSDPATVGEDTSKNDNKITLDEGRTINAFKAVLDIGLARSTTGARVFAAMKGAVDGGVEIPHSVSRFAGFNQETEEFDAEAHRDRIYGVHVANYMSYLEENNKDLYEKQFSKFIAVGLNSSNLKETYEKVHEAIRKDPSRLPKNKTQKAVEKPSKKAQKTKQKLNAFIKRKKLDARKQEFLTDLGISA